jgi:hypothetical protein
MFDAQNFAVLIEQFGFGIRDDLPSSVAVLRRGMVEATK